MSNEAPRTHKGVVLRLGVREMPWVVRAYIFLLLAFLILWLLALAAHIWAPHSGVMVADLAESCKQAVQLILGAILGSLGLAAERKWRALTDEEPESRGGSR